MQYIPQDNDYRVSPGGSSVVMFYNKCWNVAFSNEPEAIQRWLKQHSYSVVHRGTEYTYYRRCET